MLWILIVSMTSRQYLLIMSHIWDVSSMGISLLFFRLPCWYLKLLNLYALHWLIVPTTSLHIRLYKLRLLIPLSHFGMAWFLSIFDETSEVLINVWGTGWRHYIVTWALDIGHVDWSLTHHASLVQWWLCSLEALLQ